MKNNVVYVGLDVDDKNYHGGVMEPGSRSLNYFKCKPSVGHLVEQLKRYARNGNKLKLCYEATYIGYTLVRALRKHGYECDVIAPSSIPRANSRVKTDRIDCGKLAEYYMQGLLRIVEVPNEEDEEVRDYIRSRDYVVGQQAHLKLHIQSLCRRLGIDYRGSTENRGAHYWTKLHQNWLDARIKEMKVGLAKSNLIILIDQLKQFESTIAEMDKQIESISETDRYKEKKQSLICYKGIKTRTAMVLITELGDINRFDHPGRITSYIGMDVAEYSSGGKEKKYGITKQGNKHVRTALIESAQMAWQSPRMSKEIKRRREDVENKYVAIADRCLERIHRKAYRLLHNHKPMNKIKVACAREMIGFIWESLRLVSASN